MQIECDHCSHIIRYDDSIPKFCSECGAALNRSSDATRNDETMAAPLQSVAAADPEATRARGTTAGVSTQQPQPDHRPPENVGPYQVKRKLGQGGMGTVYEAVHAESGRRVALKLLSPEVRGTDEMVQRFRRESQIAASINHPRSTFVYEAGQHEGQLYITMELMGGGTLKDVVDEEGPLPVGRAVDYVLDMIDGLLVAHNAGIVHRDLKPSNSFVDSDGRIKVGDFGLAKSFLGDSSLTQTGTFMGTPQFAAPEQIRNSEIDERTDIYALGGTLFYLLCGRAPFSGNPAQVISSIASETPPKVSQFVKNVPRPLTKLIAQSLEKNPDRRPFNLNMLRDGLLPYSTRGAMAADPGRRVAAFFLDLLLITFGGGVLVAFLSPVLLSVLNLFGMTANPQLPGVAIMVPLTILYFAICESTWSRTIGKWIFGMRVVNEQSQTPTFAAALVRSLLLPGLMIAVSQIVVYMLIDPTAVKDMRDVMVMTFESQALGLLGWIPLLILISTGRRENGYRCLHGMLSGTRVVRLAPDLESNLLDEFAITVPERSNVNQQLGPFEVAGLFEQQPDGQQTLLGRDQELDRLVWLFDGFPEQPLSDSRRNLTRPSRLRVIRQAKSPDSNWWYATESVPGIRLADVFADSRCQWQAVCPLIRDVACELSSASDQRSIPADLSTDHVWLDHTGRVRVLDHPLVRAKTAPSQTAQVNGDGGEVETGEAETGRNHSRAVDTLSELFDRYMQKQEHPVSVMQIRQQIQRRRSEPDVFSWLVGRLNQSIEKPTSWNWIDRIGMFAISLGLEFAVLTAVIFLTSFLVMSISGGTLLQTAIPSVAGLLVVAGYGYFFNGGPVMQLVGLSLRRNRDRTQASRLRSMCRSLVAWSPWVLLMSALIFVMFNQLNNDPKTLNVTPENSDITVPVLLFSLVPTTLIIAGCAMAIFNPPRGLPDFLVGTRLMRK